MSVLVLLCSVLLTVAAGAFTSELASVASSRARAQTAADAAALAAVAESAPHGGGEPEPTARRFAESNGAELVGCECSPGALEAVVTVSVDGVVARARAEFDPTLLAPAPSDLAGGLHPRLKSALDALLVAGGGRIHLVSGYRPPERQEQLWSRALLKYGSPEAARKWVAPPGRSMHERGLAIDLGGDVEFAARLVRDLGLPLVRPMSWEPWHFELDPALVP